MSIISEEPAVDSAHLATSTPAAAEHPGAGAAPLDASSTGAGTTSATDSEPQPSDNLPAGTSQESSRVPDEAVPAAGASTNPFLDADDSEPTPALPPRPEDAAPAPAEHTMTTTSSEGVPAHAGADADAQEEQVSPQAAALRAMFPDFDVAVLQSVLDSVNGDQERAIDLLLGMSDPDYVSTQPAHQPEQPSVDLDEQLARQLMLEDQREQQHASGNSWPRRDQTDVPYQARQAPGGRTGVPPAEGRNDLQELQRTMGQIAESGKRTFSSIVSKVKAKINEYEATRNTGQAATTSTAPQWGPAAPSGQLDRHSASQAAYQQQYYAGEPSPVVDQPISLNGPSTTTRGPVQGYDLDAPPAQRSAPPVAAPTPTLPTAPTAGASLSPAASPRPSGDVPRPPTTTSGSPVNAAKIGLLPKRPVSLLNANAPPPTRPSDEEDELEYVENPFEERK
ncbi:hypothetical protein TRAPUB_11791 [Trametes pubescens]|uniref:CUE domain-containing protein n=1 Tax=Trametes pubescens TaxID=154538 RepID=A0A1M2VVY7_TRAPU|nr:hypothetical protein TRAPUB_11791 [Trametes pubescens]